MKWIARATLLVIAVAACMTVWFVRALEPTSTGAFVFFAIWLLVPYVIMGAVLVILGRKGTISLPWYVVAAVVCAGGIVFLANVIFGRPDAQGAIAVLMTPIFQGIALAVLLPLAWWVSRHPRS